jgi:hypothetical protein
MKVNISFLIALVLLYTSAIVRATPVLLTPSISNVQTYCYNKQPQVRFNLLIHASDQGLPGLIYIGAHNPEKTRAQFYVQETWQEFEGAIFPVYKTVREGLTHTSLSIPLDEVIAKQGWQLYVGYGALTAEDEAKVQKMSDTVQSFKSNFPEKKVNTIEPDYFRRVLIQDNMTKHGKYHYIRSWTPELRSLCD